MNDVAAYVRVSTTEQKEDGDHEQQREAIKQWADDGYDVTFFEDISVSDASENRQAYRQVMERYGEFDAVVVEKLSRWGHAPEKTLSDILKITGGVEDDGIEFISLKDRGMFDTTSPGGQEFLEMMSAMDAYYSEIRREQALEAVQRRRDRGESLGRSEKVDTDVKREAFDLRRKGVSYATIARIISDGPDGPDEISRETIRRYCKDEGVEPEI